MDKLLSGVRIVEHRHVGRLSKKECVWSVCKQIMRVKIVELRWFEELQDNNICRARGCARAGSSDKSYTRLGYLSRIHRQADMILRTFCEVFNRLFKFEFKLAPSIVE